MKLTTLFIGILVLLFSGCEFSKHRNKVTDGNDNFYSDLGGLGRQRIPLIKPYELLKVSDHEWRLELQQPGLLTLSIHNVQGVLVKDGVIAIHSSGGTEFLNKQHDNAWFIINPEIASEKAFDNEDSFKENFLQSAAPGQTLRFYSPDTLYKEFELKGKIVWE